MALMSAKMGNEFPKMGNELPISAVNNGETSYEALIGAAIRRELRGSHRSIKTLMRWTGASARTAKNWLSGAAGPSGAHLVELMKSSDLVFETVLGMAGRGQVLTGGKMAEARELLRRADALFGDNH
jgi:hypothetical protein